MKSTQDFYAVQLQRVLNRKLRLATGETAGPRLHWLRSHAVKFKNGLIEEGFRTAKVVKVRVTYTWS